MLNRLSLNRIGLNRIGLNRIGKSSGGSSDRPYIDPKVLDSLCGVWIMDQNTNESESRNIIKNKIADRGGDLELLNFAYKANSGYNGYPEDFTSWAPSNAEVSKGGNKAKNTKVDFNLMYTYSSIKRDIEPFKVKISNFTKGIIRYWYRQEDGIETTLLLEPITVNNSNGLIELPKSYNTVENGTGFRGGFTGNDTNIGVTIEQLPLHEGALVTDGKDDMIVSQKTVQEMLGGSNVCTVVSMIHQINLSTVSNTSINNIRSESVAHVCARILNTAYGKTGIFGYSKQLNTTSNPTLINNILGDKKDYIADGASVIDTTDKYFVQGYKYNDSLYELSEVAVYWTFISNKVLTTDEINQIIAYYKLDKYVTPQVIYDVKRQGLTNDTPAADWYLKDFSGNGHDMQLYNYAKTPESGINEDGGLQSDGIDDYGKAEGLPILKDYTVAADYARLAKNISSIGDSPILSKSMAAGNGAFIMNSIDNSGITACYSFGTGNSITLEDIQRKIYYQSKYSNQGKGINAGSAEDGTSMWLDTIRDNDTRFIESAFYSMLLFQYTLSEFLLERQLKKYKLGTLYPDMVEVRPIVKSNTDNYMRIEYRNGQGGLIQPGSYLPVGSILRISVVLNDTLDEVSSLKVNGVDISKSNYSGGSFWIYDATVTKSPQKIDITINEYIRFEDIVQPYPAIVNIPKVDGGYYTYGDKIPVGYRFRRESAINLLPELYSLNDIFLNGELCNVGAEIVISKYMVFTANKTWLLDTTEPHAIYSPQKLNIPNSSLKILGYVPDLTGKGNHGKLNNFAYAEDSGVAADGSIKFNGTDDHITIPTLAHGGKCVMMKVNWSNESGTIYDQRVTDSGEFAIFLSENNLDNEIVPAYGSRNNGNTYIDGILNTSILTSQLKSITHNITIANDKVALENTASPFIGCKSAAIGFFANMAMYEFMLFPEIPSEDEIKKLNNVMGIEGGYVESPNYYWDAYGKANRASADIDYKDLSSASDAHKQLIDKSIEGLAAIELYHSTGNFSGIKDRRLYLNNFAFDSESGYSQIVDTVLFKNWIVLNGTTYIEYTSINDTTINITKSNRVSIDAFYCRANVKKKSYYKITGLQEGQGIQFGFTNNIIYTAVSDGVHEVDWSLVPENYQELSTTFVGDCNITIEQVAQYPNGLLLDGIEDHAVNTVIPAVTDFTVIAKREFPESVLVNNQTFLVKGDAINGNNNINSLLMECHWSGNYVILFQYQNTVPLEESKISWVTPTSYNGNAITKGSGVDSVGLTIGRYKDLYRKSVLYKLMFYTKTIDQLSINMLKNLFERDELIDVTNLIFKKQ